MSVIRRHDRMFFALDRYATRWVDDVRDATVFATRAAAEQCLMVGRLSRDRHHSQCWIERLEP
jgi:hypothetical protein